MLLKMNSNSMALKLCAERLLTSICGFHDLTLSTLAAKESKSYEVRQTSIRQRNRPRRLSKELGVTRTMLL